MSFCMDITYPKSFIYPINVREYRPLCIGAFNPVMEPLNMAIREPLIINNAQNTFKVSKG